MMKPFAESPWKQRGLFFLAGAIFTFICGIIRFKWMDIIPFYGNFSHQPDWLKGLKRLIGWLPWIAFAVVLVFRFVKGRRVRVGFYFLGTVAPMILLIGWFIFGDGVANLIHRQEFNAEHWQNQEKVEHDNMWPPRLCMVDHLMSSGKLDGLTSNQVI